MKLGEWLSKNGVSQEAFGEILGVYQSDVSDLVLGKRVPKLAMVQKITDATKGEVTFTDFVDAKDRVSPSRKRKNEVKRAKVKKRAVAAARK